MKANISRSFLAITSITLVAVAASVLTLFVARTSGQATPPKYTPPRTADGHADLQGIWQAMNAASYNVEDHGPGVGIPAGYGVVEGGELPYQPWALEKRKENFAKRATEDTVAKCYLPGVPRAMYMPFPFQIIQPFATKAGDPEAGLDRDLEMIIYYEYQDAIRYVQIDGSKHLGLGDLWMGDSRGRWDGDTLVIDVTEFNDRTWFDAAGNFHSDELHVIERFTRTGPDTMQYEATIEDPKVFTRPWKMSFPLYRRQEKNFRISEYYCYSYVEEERLRAGK